MEQEKQSVVGAPDLSHEEMKLPENSTTQALASNKPESSAGRMIIVMLVLLLIAILVGMYYWFSQLPVKLSSVEELPMIEVNNEPESSATETATASQQTVSPSDEIATIEADLIATDLESLDAELNAIEAELDTALDVQP